MSVRMIQERLDTYRAQSDLEELHALREITQEVVLGALSRGEFFKHALFQGGTCLRIFHGLNRFSEDLDFLCRKHAPDFKWADYLPALKDELSSFGYQFEVTDRNEATTAVKKAFLKDDSLGKVLSLQYSNRTGPLAKIRIKLEIDTHPPQGSGEVVEYLDFPFVATVQAQDMPSLFAGKIHALLCRDYTKGRDWYDFLWYTSRRTPINYNFLSSALDQLGPWSKTGPRADKGWVGIELGRKIAAIDWHQAAEDVRRFLPAREQASLDLWSAALFLHQLDRWQTAQLD